MTEDSGKTFPNDRALRVTEADDGARLDRVCKRHWPDVPQGLLQKSSRKGMLRLDGKRAKPETRVEAGQTIQLRGAIQQSVEERQKLAMTPEQVTALRHRILLEREQLIILNKPSGLAVQGGSGTERHLDGMLEALQGPYPERPKLVHRLDRDTSGVLVLARDTKSAAVLTKAFAGREVQKVYWALVLGSPKLARAEIDKPLIKGREGNERERMIVDFDEGQPAQTQYRVVERVLGPNGESLSWLELMPITGRTHQLRAHLLAIGHPIVGDKKYGGPRVHVDGLPATMHLHARRLLLDGVPGLAPIDVKAPLPDHMKESWEILGLPKDDLGVSLIEVGL